jgi:hypothetical protein
MKHELHEWNISYATYETSLMQHMKCNSHAHAHERVNDAYAHTNVSAMSKLNTRGL